MGSKLLSGYQGKLAMLPSAAHEALTLLCLLKVLIPTMEVTWRCYELSARLGGHLHLLYSCTWLWRYLYLNFKLGMHVWHNLRKLWVVGSYAFSLWRRAESSDFRMRRFHFLTLDTRVPTVFFCLCWLCVGVASLLVLLGTLVFCNYCIASLISKRSSDRQWGRVGQKRTNLWTHRTKLKPPTVTKTLEPQDLTQDPPAEHRKPARVDKASSRETKVAAGKPRAGGSKRTKESDKVEQNPKQQLGVGGFCAKKSWRSPWTSSQNGVRKKTWSNIYLNKLHPSSKPTLPTDGYNLRPVRTLIHSFVWSTERQR